MTPSQRDYILQVIDKDADGRGSLCEVDDAGAATFCILGGIAHDIGFSVQQLRNKGMPSEVRAKVNGLTLLRHLEILGIPRDKRGQLMATNDDFEWRVGLGNQQAARRKRLRKLVNSWEVD